jgi:ABC-type bacteriocin/lantibiotic exporter with double-glycine peptidase domain
MKLQRKIPKYKQGGDDNECGPVCIKMAVDAFLKPEGGRITKNDLVRLKKKRLIMDTPGGTSKTGMKKAIKSLGFGCKELVGKKGTRLKMLKTIIDRNHPVILGCNIKIKGKPYSHYIVLVGVDEHKQILYIHDPYPKSKYSKIKIEKFTTRGNDLSWGNKMWGIEVFPRSS